ncbi:MAG TPA: hypothetical protein VLZ74_04885 [Methylocella sp.]|nr:hypothetical protein [Methylocella sp.]
MIDRRLRQDNEHHSEPEIIPPGRVDFREVRSGVWGQVTSDQRDIHRIYVTRVGPWGLLPFFLLAGVIGAALLIFMLGAFLILIPLAGLVLAATIFGGMLRGGRSRWLR